jgi:two-component system nitrate/nitrite sensor histidine kinase NarX
MVETLPPGTSVGDQQAPERVDSGGLSGLLERQPVLRILVAARLVGPLVALAGVAGASVALAALVYVQPEARGVLSGPLLVLLLVMVLLLLLLVQRLRSRLLKPLTTLEASVAQVCQGEPGASLGPVRSGVLAHMARDIDSLSEELTDLYEDMDSRVARQTARLAQKTASLKILYDVAASINQARELDELLLRFLRILKEMVSGRAATVRLASGEGRMRLVGSIGLDNQLLQEDQLLPVQLCQCGRALAPGDILCEHDPDECSRLNHRLMFGPDDIQKVSVPLDYHGDTLGIYDIFVAKPGISGREDILELLATIGSHLGMAVAKQRSDAEARRLAIVEERTNLAHELHDSLAQTLASLRFQVRMLDETLEQSAADPQARAEAGRIRSGLDQAHTEVRDLLNNFRAPLERRGLIPALDRLQERFRKETGIATFFQRDCRQLDLSTSEEMQMLRIVQEALANIRKHADAHTVRILLRCRVPGQYILLVEDDGQGFGSPQREGHPGEHIGLSIMQERARRLGGELRVESEPGEGTRVELRFRPGSKLRDAPEEAPGSHSEAID